MTHHHTLERFLGGIHDPVAAHMLQTAMASGYQLVSALVSVETVPAVVILAAYARHYDGTELVDDYDRLLDDFRQAVSEPGQTFHSDLYLASCINILSKRELHPEQLTFTELNIPTIYEQLLAGETYEATTGRDDRRLEPIVSDAGKPKARRNKSSRNGRRRYEQEHEADSESSRSKPVRQARSGRSGRRAHSGTRH